MLAGTKKKQTLRNIVYKEEEKVAIDCITKDFLDEFFFKYFWRRRCRCRTQFYNLAF